MHIVLYLVGNQIDLDHNEEVPENIAKEFASQNGMKFKYVSAKTGFKIDEMFVDIGNEYLKNKERLNVPRKSTYIKRDNKPRKKRTCC